MTAAEPLPAENVKPIAIRTPRAPATRAPTSPLDIVNAALASGSVEMYREAVALMKEMDQFAARKAFDAAMADAKAEIPTIKRNRSVDAGGKGPKYRFEDLAEIAQTVDPILSKHGLSYRYRVASPINAPVTVTCIVSHRDGHFEETTLTAGRDDGPGRNAIQQVASTITYLQRYSLKAALGLAVSHDDDGQSSESPAAPQAPAGSISPAEVEELRLLLADKGASERAFLAWASNPQRAYVAAGDVRMEAIKADAFMACKAGILAFVRR
jgi:hypothetical protein